VSPPRKKADSSPPCSTCHGFGVLEHPKTGQLLPCKCREVAIVEARVEDAGIPERYRNCSLQNWNALEPSLNIAGAMARKFVREWPAVDHGILIVGPVGRGKTHLAVAILLDLIREKGVRGVFCDFTDLLSRIQATFGRNADENPDEILSPYRDAELLVLDELGARRPTDWAREVLYGLLNTRYNRNRITILTTNFDDEPEKPGDETLEVRVGSAVRSRLFEMCRTIRVSGPDFRKEVKGKGRAF
jgi:DNA replication protein DnaC